MADDICENCGRKIGKLETPYLHREHVVCHECNERLNPSPLAYAAPVANVVAPQVQTIEQTSKLWKGQILMACLVMLASPVLWVIGVAVPGLEFFVGLGVLAFAGGLVWYFVAKSMVWWEHG